MLILFQERTANSGIYFERSILSRGERAGRLRVCWYDGRLTTWLKTRAIRKRLLRKMRKYPPLIKAYNKSQEGL